MVLSHHFNPLHRSFTLELLFPRAAVPQDGCASISRACMATSWCAHWQTKQLKVSDLLIDGLTK